MEIPPKQPMTDYITIPAGTYRVRIAEVRQRETRRGNTLWALRLVVAGGEFEGRTAAWDNLVFSPRGSTRVANVYRALGVGEHAGDEVLPEHLVGREALVTVRPAEYLAADGQVIRRNEVAYDGWEAIAR
jgi:Protein of unknown function (DUF669)